MFGWYKSGLLDRDRMTASPFYMSKVQTTICKHRITKHHPNSRHVLDRDRLTVNCLLDTWHKKAQSIICVNAPRHKNSEINERSTEANGNRLIRKRLVSTSNKIFANTTHYSSRNFNV